MRRLLVFWLISLAGATLAPAAATAAPIPRGSNAVGVLFADGPATSYSTSISATTGRYVDPVVRFQLVGGEPDRQADVKACVAAWNGFLTLGCRREVRDAGDYAVPLRTLTGVRLTAATALLGQTQITISTRRLPPHDLGQTYSGSATFVPLRLRLTR